MLLLEVMGSITNLSLGDLEWENDGLLRSGVYDLGTGAEASS
jgi:hypothetical protein